MSVSGKARRRREIFGDLVPKIIVFMKKINEKRPLKPQKFLGAFGAECAHLIFLSKIAQIFLVDFFWYIFFGSKKSTKKRKIANYQIGRFFLPKKKVWHELPLVFPTPANSSSMLEFTL